MCEAGKGEPGHTVIPVCEAGEGEPGHGLPHGAGRLIHTPVHVAHEQGVLHMKKEMMRYLEETLMSSSQEQNYQRKL